MGLLDFLMGAKAREDAVKNKNESKDLDEIDLAANIMYWQNQNKKKKK